ncbi:MAG: HAMP domain-containing histidine kinase [Gammaproteobacteria bacterium]|nr:HAMP domain-containing histidine kinase [Gammaproteobacteria bacterium]
MIRSIVVVILLAILFWLRFNTAVSVPWVPLFVILSVIMLINLLVFWRLRYDWPVSENELFANLLLDVFFLTLVLYFTGGSTNPIVSYYLIPLIISAAVLRPAHTWFIAFLSIAFYTALLFYYQPLDLFTMSGHGAMTSAHFLGMWINFGFSAVLISWFVVRMAGTLKEQSRAIARNRESGLRNEQIISVASIAAGTAHEMRTPLATMAVTVDDIAYDHPELKDEMAVLEQQIERCDAVLRELVSTNTEDSQMVVTEFGTLLDSLSEKWSLARPEIKLQKQVPGQILKLEIRYDQSLQHALVSLLNNAADASPEYVLLQAEALNDSILIIIEDHGPGIPAEIADSLGKTYISRKHGGLGLGVLLSQSSIERLGGEVSMIGMAGKGTRLEIRFPLLKVANNG